jgi:hypothetical protein
MAALRGTVLERAVVCLSHYPSDGCQLLLSHALTGVVHLHGIRLAVQALVRLITRGSSWWLKMDEWWLGQYGNLWSLQKFGRVGKHHQWRSGSYIVTQGCDCQREFVVIYVIMTAMQLHGCATFTMGGVRFWTGKT